MAEPNVYNVSDARGYGSRLEDARALKSIEFQDKALARLARELSQDIAQTQERGVQFAMDEIKRLHTAKPKEEQIAIGQDIARKYVTMFQKRAASKKRALSDAIDEGAFARPQNIELSDVQKWGLQNNKGFRFSPAQAEYRYLLTLDEDERMALLSHRPEAVERARKEIDQLTQETQYHAPSKSFSWAQRLFEDDSSSNVLTRTSTIAANVFNAFPSLAAGMYKALREIAPGRLEPADETAGVWKSREEFRRAPADFAGVDMKDLEGKLFDDPSLLFDIVGKGIEYGWHTLRHGSSPGEPTTLSYQFEAARREIAAAATQRAYAQLYAERGGPPKQSDHIALSESIQEDLLGAHAGAFVLNHPYISEFAISVLMPSGLPQIVGAAKGATRLARTGVRMAAESETGMRASRSVARYIEHNQGLKETIESFGRTKAKIRRGFVYQAWAKDLAKGASDDELRQIVQMHDQMAIGKVDEARKVVNEKVKTLLSVEDPDEALHIFYALDEPWAMATLPEELEAGYQLIIPHLLRARAKPGATAEQIRTIVGRLENSRALTGAEKQALRPFYGPRASAARELVADVLENPHTHVFVPEHLRDAFQAGLDLKTLDQGLKEAAGTMNRFVKASRGRGARAVERGTLGGDTMRPSLKPREQAMDKYVLARGRFRDHWVPHADWSAEATDALPEGLLAPLHKNMRHKSALTRKLSIEESIQRGLVMNVGKQFEAHFATALDKYQRGMQLRAFDDVVKGRGYFVKLRARDADGAVAFGERAAQKAEVFRKRHAAMLEKIGGMEARYEYLSKLIQEGKESGKAVAAHSGRLGERIGKIASRVRANERAQQVARENLAQAQKSLARVEQEIAGGARKLQEKYALQDRVVKHTGEVRSLTRQHVKMTQRVTELELGDPSKLPRRAGSRLGPLTEQETRVAQMPRQEALKFLEKVAERPDRAGVTRRMELLTQKRGRLLRAIAKQRDEANRLLTAHQTYMDTAQIAGAEAAYRTHMHKQMLGMKASLESQTGLKWVDISDPQHLGAQTYREYLRVTGALGESPTSTAVLVPQPFAAYINDAMPWLTSNEKPLEAAVAVYDDIMSHWIRPVQKAWRGLVTVPRMLYTAVNMTSAVGLGAIALKTRSLNPELQAKAMAAAVLSAWDTEKAMELARGITFHANNGTTRGLDEVLAIAKRLRLTSQLEGRIGTDIATKGKFGLEALPKAVTSLTELMPLQKGAAAVGRAVGAEGLGEAATNVFKGLSPAFGARATENYQHLITFMGFLDDFSEKGIAKAFDLSSKWSANYNLLGPVEKTLVKDVFAFWGWYRFIGPHLFRMVSERPEGVAAIIRARGSWEAYAGKHTPVEYHFLPAALKGVGLGAPESVQPQSMMLDPDVAWFAGATLEDPLSLSLALTPYIEGLITAGARGRPIQELMGPAVRLMIDMVTMRDEDGRELPPWLDPRDKVSAQDSLLMRYFVSGPETPVGPFLNLIKLYKNRPEQNTYRLALTVGRQWLGLDNHVARMLGAQPRSIGGMTDPATGGRPGVRYYPIQLRREIAKAKRKAVRHAQDTVWRQERIIERGNE